MAVHCAKCGEELLGAVNRCWKCGQKFDLRPEIDGRPPVRLEMPPAPPPQPAPDNAEAVDVVVLEEGETEASRATVINETAPQAAEAVPQSPPTTPPSPVAAPRYLPRRVVNASELVEARRKSAMAMGGTVGAIVLGAFAIVLAPFRFEAAFIALIGIVMGVWGLYSTRRNWALAAMLLCCIAVGLGVFTGTRQLYLRIQEQRPVEIEAPVEDEDA
jgi:hypothetical protein